MTSILKKVGADRILDPEEEGGLRVAQVLSTSLLDYVEVDENFCIVELRARKEWIGKNLIELNLRKNYNMNVVAVKDHNEMWSFADPKIRVKEKNDFLVALEKKDLKKWK
jgi:trk system potassium uptake protein TrkA